MREIKKEFPKKEVFGKNVWVWDSPKSGHWLLTKTELKKIAERKEIEKRWKELGIKGTNK